jgi:hypothetical protein
MILKDHDDDHHHRHDEDEDDDDDDDDDSEDADAYFSLCCLIIGPGHFARTLTRCLFL